MKDFRYIFGSALLHMYSKNDFDLKGSETDVAGIYLVFENFGISQTYLSAHRINPF